MILTQAVWQAGIHSGSLADISCSEEGQRPALTLPSFAKGSNFNGKQRKGLWRILAKGGIARVDLVGVFRASKGRDYGPDGLQYQIEIQCLLSVTPISNPTHMSR